MSNIYSKIVSTGIYLPERVMSNFDIAKIVDTSDQWIYERTGIKNRRICSPDGGEYPTDMACRATEMALERAQMDVNSIDMILFASVTPDMQIPNSSSILQTKLGITNQCACMDISAACSGFVYGINVADSMIRSGSMKNILVVASEMLSREIDWKDRSSCILFGDGCGVAIISATDESDPSRIIATHLSTDGTGKKFFEKPIGGAVTPYTKEILEEDDWYMKMKGGEMFKVATRTLAANAKAVIKKAGLNLDKIDWMVPHQANQRIIDTTGSLLGIDSSKVIINIENVGNTSAASIPLAFHEAVDDGRIKKGDLILFDTFGAGLTSGATVFKY
ncbi:MAG: ketoacyl-ACP synthase III [Bdellovibrionales bacterium]|nr:ketoacyl-ACP synthase III [Bdellovibrionales bacterium]MBT3526461.1 ketoacyl-ACP synthase III [Bdellovibrionales bacterium]MBT7768019.1 ketoacyl-ACP synthase III [Bdellovibrionales bacterium]